MSVQAAVTALEQHDHMSQVLRACIAFGGDVDTVATIALAAGAGCVEIVQDLPASLIAGLEHGPYGSDYLIALDRQLAQRVVRPQ